MTRRSLFLYSAAFAGNAIAQTPYLQGVIRIRLDADGFDPLSVKVPPGRYLFAIDNRTRIPAIRFALDSLRPGSAPLRVLNINPEARMVRIRQVLNLAPGQYELTVGGRETWKCAIIVA